MIAPSVPRSPGHRRALLKAAYHRLARAVRVPVAELIAADGARLRAIVATVDPAVGRPGDARRLVMKVLRLRG